MEVPIPRTNKAVNRGATPLEIAMVSLFLGKVYR